MPRVWQIRGYDGLTEIFRQDVPASSLSEGAMRAVLMALVARFEMLEGEDIVGAYTQRNRHGRNVLLETYRDGPQPHFWCGHGSVHFTARAVMLTDAS